MGDALRRISTWLYTNITADRIIAFATLAQSVILLIGLYSLVYAKKTLDEGNRIAWRAYLDNKSAEMGRVLLKNNFLHCVYRYNLARIDNDCPTAVYDKTNLPKVIEYVAQYVEHLKEVKKYSDEEDQGYYAEWYAKTGRDLSDDPSGVVSFVLWEYQGCGDAQASKGPSVQERNCDVAKQLEICITNRSFEVEPLQCLRNLKARRDEFLQKVAEPPTR